MSYKVDTDANDKFYREFDAIKTKIIDRGGFDTYTKITHYMTTESLQWSIDDHYNRLVTVGHGWDIDWIRAAESTIAERIILQKD